MQKETVFAAVINRDVASYLQQDEMENLAIVNTIQRPFPVLGLYFATLEEYFGSLEKAERMLTCYSSFENDIVHKSEQQYFRSTKVSVWHQYILRIACFYSYTQNHISA